MVVAMPAVPKPKPTARSLGAALATAILLTACGVLDFANPCALHPVEAPQEGAFRIGPARALAASCAAEVEVDGQRYGLSPGGWLDEELLALEEYGQITRTNWPVDDPVAYALEGIDPHAFLVVRGPDAATEDAESMGEYMALFGTYEGAFPAEVCRYADPDPAQIPPECDV